MFRTHPLSELCTLLQSLFTISYFQCKPHSDPARFDIPQHHHHHHTSNNNKVWGSPGWWSSLLGLVIMIILFIFYLASFDSDCEVQNI